MKCLVFLSVACLLFACGTDAPPPADKPIIIKDPQQKPEASNPYVSKDISPMDMAYFPSDYPVKKMKVQGLFPPKVRVIYSRPHRSGRQVFGGLVKWGEAWRLGANEATEIQFFEPVKIAGKSLDKGQYIMYAIPYQDKWEIVFNSNLYAWGLEFNPLFDVLKVEVPATTKTQMVEDFTISFEKTATGADLIMAWEAMEVRLPIQF